MDYGSMTDYQLIQEHAQRWLSREYLRVQYGDRPGMSIPDLPAELLAEINRRGITEDRLRLALPEELQS